MFNWTLSSLPVIYFFHRFLITDTSSVAGKDLEHTDSKKFDQVSPTTATKYKQASGSNPEQLAPAGVQLTPSTSLAPGFSLTSRPSSNIEQDEMLMRAKSQSLGETFIDAASMDMGFSRERCIEAVEANLRY